MVSYDDFKKLDIRIGKVIACEKIENADKLLRLEVDFGPLENDSSRQEIRQIVSGLALYYKPEELIGKQLPFLYNLEPRTFRGIESQGMLVAVNAQGQPVLLQPDKEIPLGSKIC
ncbi:MAG: methionine--tRNA ligase [Candidatus Levybacteria bacterium]|nr:methionine--tRNA ligase [Candidatus Levybacteria bacterium]